MDELKPQIVKCLKSLKENETVIRFHLAKMPLFTDHLKISKDSLKSEKARNEGNRLYTQKNHDSSIHHKIIHLYNESIAYAPNDSEELASAYGNKSALLRHIRKYSESIEEADRALKITKSASLKVKLLCRKAECYTALDLPENRHSLEKARFILTKSELSEKLMKYLSDLIDKTQTVIETGKIEIPKENKKKVLAAKIIADASEIDIWSSVHLEYSQKDGRHLVAARDFKAGEIIIVEKPYMSHLTESHTFIYCNYCFNYLWTVVPCDHCTWRLYCTERCKNEAWDEYHDMECSAYIQMKENLLFETYLNLPLLLGGFIKALKEAGSVHQLQDELRALDSCKDEREKGFPSDGKFASYKSMYLLPTRDFHENEYEDCINSTAMALMGLAKYTNIFGRSYNFDEIKELIKNDAALFAGAFIFKFNWIVTSRKTNVRLFDPSETDPKKRKDAPVSCSLKSLGYLFPLSCVPNSRMLGADNNKEIMYALHPINKGTMLTTSIASIYEFISKSERQATIRDFYNRSCNCRACTENWLEIRPDGKNYVKNYEIVDPMGAELIHEVNRHFEELFVKAQKPNFSDIKFLTRTKILVEKSWDHFRLPSLALVRAITMMMKTMDALLGLVYEKAPSSCLK